jgi:hypothetical protein
MSRIGSTLRLWFAPERRAWHGHMPLATVFWGYGVATSLLIVALHATALQRGQLSVQQALIVLSVGYTVWIVVAIWRSAANADPFRGTLARWLTIAWALNSVLVLFFLQVELALRYARG